MIKADKDGVSIEFHGSLPDFLTEITMMNRAIRGSLSKQIGEKMADTLLDQAYRLSKMSEADLEKENVALEILGFLLEGATIALVA